MKNTNLKLILTLVMIIGFFGCSTVISSLTNYVSITSFGQISILNIHAQSGSAEDIQAAVDWIVAHGGIGNVHIPSGEFNFNLGSQYGVNVPEGVNIFGQGIDRTILRENLPPGNDIPMFRVTGANNPYTRISGITFISYPFTKEDEPYTTAIQISSLTDYRIDNCKFINFSSKAIQADNWYGAGSNRGVIDHCHFDNPYHDDPNVMPPDGSIRKTWGYGIILVAKGRTQDVTSILGKYDGMENIAYIEDCHFSRNRHSIAGNNKAWYVVRHCTFEEPRPEHFGIIDVHWGGRGLEAYNNTIRGCEYYYDGSGNWLSLAFLIRGGGGIIFNNDIIDCYRGISLVEELPAENPIHDLYIWGNQMIRDQRPFENEMFIDAHDQVEGVDYFLYEYPEYEPYPYPHPLTLKTTPQ